MILNLTFSVSLFDYFCFSVANPNSIQSSASIHLYIISFCSNVPLVFNLQGTGEEDTFMFRPCIDLHEGEVKQIVGASLTKSKIETNFKSERPSTYFAEMYKVCSIRIRNRENVTIYPHHSERRVEGRSCNYVGTR